MINVFATSNTLDLNKYTKTQEYTNFYLVNKDKESGITIHYVNAEVDGGEIIAQYECEVKKDDTPETLAERVHQLEYKYFPEVIENLLSN